jgi:hypothetical protein
MNIGAPENVIEMRNMAFRLSVDNLSKKTKSEV